MTKRTQVYFDQVKAAVEAANDKLTADEYRDLLEEIDSEVDGRLTALDEDEANDE